MAREFLASHVLGSPGGYPVFINRWTRMGQARDENLQRLLMLGEPEAVVAVWLPPMACALRLPAMHGGACRNRRTPA